MQNESQRHNDKGRAKTSLEKIYLSLYCKVWKGLLRVLLWEGVGDRTKTAIYWPHSYGHQRCLSHSPDAQPEARGLSFLLSAGFLYHILSPTDLRNYWGPRGSLRLGVAFPTTSYQQLLWSSTHQGLQGFPPPGFLYHILSATYLDPNSSGAPRVALAWRGFPYHISSLTPTVWLLDLTELYNSSTPTQSLEWFDRHQAEITDMQFRGHSLPVHHSVAAQWDLHLVPYYQPSSPARFLSINGHWDVSLPLSLEWHVCPGWRSKYNTNWNLS